MELRDCDCSASRLRFIYSWDCFWYSMTDMVRSRSMIYEASSRSITMNLSSCFMYQDVILNHMTWDLIQLGTITRPHNEETLVWLVMYSYLLHKRLLYIWRFRSYFLTHCQSISYKHKEGFEVSAELVWKNLPAWIYGRWLGSWD